MKLLISDYPHPRQDYNPGKHIVRLQTLMSPKEKKAASTFHDVDSDYVVIRQNPLMSLALHRLDREYYWLSKEDAMAWMQCVNDAIPILQEKLDKRIAELYPEEPEPEQEPEPEATVPEIEERHWYAHALLLAQTQRGKTNVICWRLATLLPQIARGRASVVLMEPKGVLTDELLHLAEVWTMRERLVIIDPQDTSVSVNIFDKGDGSNFATQQALERVQRVLNTVTTTLTSFQTDALNFALRAMFAMPGRGSLRTVVNILRRGVGDIPNLPVSVRDFFEHDFEPGKSQAAQIIARLC